MFTDDTPPPEFIDTYQAADLLGVPHRYLLRLIRMDLIPHYRMPINTIRLDKHAVLEWLRAHASTNQEGAVDG